MSITTVDRALNVVYTGIGTVAAVDNFSGVHFLKTLGYGALKKYALPPIYAGAWSTFPVIFLSKKAREGDSSWAANMCASLGYRALFTLVTFSSVHASAEEEEVSPYWTAGWVVSAIVIKGVVYYFNQPRPVTTVAGPVITPLVQTGDLDTQGGENDKVPLIDDGKGVIQ